MKKQKQKKLAIFVKGLTERIFVRKLRWELAGVNKLTLKIIKSTEGGVNSEIPVIQWIKGEYTQENAPFFIQLVDCGGDEKVVSDIKEQKWI